MFLEILVHEGEYFLCVERILKNSANKRVSGFVKDFTLNIVIRGSLSDESEIHLSAYARSHLQERRDYLLVLVLFTIAQRIITKYLQLS